MKQRDIGRVHVGEVGLGGLPMSVGARPAEVDSIATIHAALDAGVSLIDTADAYINDGDEVGHNERLVAKALSTFGGDTAHVLVSTKGGHVRPGGGRWTVNGSPSHLKSAARASARRLGVDAIGLYYFHRPDPEVDYADSLGAIQELLDDGVVRMAGISNANVEQIRLATSILGSRLVAVQNQFSPAFRSSAGELALCRQLGIAFLSWSPFGGPEAAQDLGGAGAPFEQVGLRLGVSAHRVCLAWMLALGPHVIPIPGAARPDHIRDSAMASDLVLSADEMAELPSLTLPAEVVAG
jgi:aryl-alcohol dehydrogenase-like predicted oxidoreductase